MPFSPALISDFTLRGMKGLRAHSQLHSALHVLHLIRSMQIRLARRNSYTCIGVACSLASIRCYARYNQINYKLIAGDPHGRPRHRSASKTYASGSNSKSIPSSCTAQINLSISCVFSNSREVFRNPFWVAASAFVYCSDAMLIVREGDVCVAASEIEDSE